MGIKGREPKTAPEGTRKSWGQILSPWLEDIVDSDKGLSYRPASLGGTGASWDHVLSLWLRGSSRRWHRVVVPARHAPYVAWRAGMTTLCQSRLYRMRSSLVVRASDCQCTSCNGPGFDPSIRRHSGIWGAADEAVLNNVWKRINPPNINK